MRSVVVAESERENAVETPTRPRDRRLEQHFAQSCERVFVFGVEAHRFFEPAARPRILLPCEPGRPMPTSVRRRAGRVPGLLAGLDASSIGFVVELMRAFVVVVGAQERFDIERASRKVVL